MSKLITKLSFLAYAVFRELMKTWPCSMVPSGQARNAT